MDLLCLPFPCDQFVPACKVKIVYGIKKVPAVEKQIRPVRSDLVENIEVKRSIFQRELDKVQGIERMNVCSYPSSLQSDPNQNASVVTMHPADLLRLIRQKKQMIPVQPASEIFTPSSDSDECRKRKLLSLSESEEKPAKRPKYKFNPDFVWTNNKTAIKTVKPKKRCFLKTKTVSLSEDYTSDEDSSLEDDDDDDDDFELEKLAKEIEEDVLMHLNS